MIPTSWLVAARALSLAVATWAIVRTGLRITFSPAGIALITLLVALAAGGWFLRRSGRRGWRACGETARYLETLAVLCLAGSVTSYAAAAASHGFVDPMLARLDQEIGFNWSGLYHFVAAHPNVQAISRFVYRSIYLSPILLFGYFAWTGRVVDARRLLFALWLALNGCVLGMWLAPAMGAFVFLHDAVALYRPIYSDEMFRTIVALRAHAIPVDDFGIRQGLISIPSFHAAYALLYMGASWRLRRLRWAILPLNAVMLVATPIEGSHYLADLVAGAALALAAAGVTRLVSRAVERFPLTAREPARGAIVRAR